jgi:hypothetical protein
MFPISRSITSLPIVARGVFGWFLIGVYTATTFRDVLIVKGGNSSGKLAEHDILP